MRGKIQVSKHSLDTLLPGAYLDGTVLEAYLRQLERRSGVQSGSSRILALDPYIFFDLDRRRPDLVNRRFKNINPFTKDLIFIPLHTPGNPGHWSLICARPQQRRLEAYDSLNISHKGRLYQFLNVLKRYAKAHDIDFSDGWIFQESLNDIPKQSDQFNCGVFVAWFAERLSRGVPLTNPGVNFNPNVWRQHMVEAVQADVLSSDAGAAAEKRFATTVTTPIEESPTVTTPICGNVLEEPGKEEIEVLEIISKPPNPNQVTYTPEPADVPTLNELKPSDSWSDLVNDLMDLTEATQTRLEEGEAVEPSMELEISELLSGFELIDLPATQRVKTLDIRRNEEDVMSPCLSITAEEMLEDSYFNTVPMDIGTNQPACTSSQNRVPTDGTIVPELPKQKEIGIITETNVDFKLETIPDSETENKLTPQPPKRKRQKKVRVFFPGLGWQKIPKRLVRPDLKW